MLMKQVHAKILVAIFILSALIGAQLATPGQKVSRSEEHTSELQSRLHLVCRLLLEKKKIFHIAQKVAMLHNGLIVESVPEDLIQAPENSVIRRLSAATPNARCRRTEPAVRPTASNK